MSDPCPICGNAPNNITPGDNDICHVDCNICGRYRIQQALALEANRTRKVAEHPFRYALQGSIREANERLDELLLQEDNVINYLIEPRTLDGFFDRLDRILLYIVRHSKRAGDWVHLNPDLHYPIAFAKDREEFNYMLQVLTTDLSYIQGESGNYQLTPKGLKRVDDIKPRITGTGKQCFVAMWFAEELNGVYSSGFEPAIRSAGYNPVRIDKVHHNEKICDRIIAEIRRSRIVVADFTGHRGGVYFEAGFAMGLGLPIIWTCRADELNKTHFDTRQYNHIEWQTGEDLRQKLYDRICATLPVVSTG